MTTVGLSLFHHLDARTQDTDLEQSVKLKEFP
jgi:hypothetical protein